MTREEKISRLNDILSEINENDNAVCYLTSEDNELIESAIKALEQESCDAISRQAAIEVAKQYWYKPDIAGALAELPPVQPKTGHWIYDKRIENWKCSECGCSPKTIGYVGRAEFMREHFKFCNHCGAKMIEPQAGK